MNCELHQVVRPEDVDVQSELEGLEPVPTVISQSIVSGLLAH
jgi:hypothetical protein